VQKGVYFFKEASRGDKFSRYHLEAGIAYWHTIKADTKEKWENILQLYNRLLQLQYSPIAALNRTYALSKANGISEAIVEAEKLNLKGNHFYFTLLGEIYKNVDKQKAKAHFEQAYLLTKTKTDRQVIRKQIESL
jgi:RNA polymerase sigma-70 factor (ECF subfamily)